MRTSSHTVLFCLFRILRRKHKVAAVFDAVCIEIAVLHGDPDTFKPPEHHFPVACKDALSLQGDVRSKENVKIVRVAETGVHGIGALHNGQRSGGKVGVFCDFHHAAIENAVGKGGFAAKAGEDLLRKTLVMHVAAGLGEPFLRAQGRGKEEIIHVDDVYAMFFHKVCGKLFCKGAFACGGAAVNGNENLLLFFEQAFYGVGKHFKITVFHGLNISIFAFVCQSVRLYNHGGLCYTSKWLHVQQLCVQRNIMTKDTAMPRLTNHYLMTIARCSNQFRTEKLKEYGLSGQHCAYLLRISREPGLTQDMIAKELFVNKSTVARQLRFLEEKGYVRRCPSPQDQRALQVFPTEKTEAVLPRVRAVLREWNDYITAGFTEEEKIMYRELLMRAAQRARSSLDGVRQEDMPE